MRMGGAQARRVLLDSVAKQWNVPVGELTTEPSTVVHAKSGRRISYGDVVKFAAVPNVTVEDQFGPGTVLVKKPRHLCVPANKNGEDPTAPDHAGYLVCYQVKQTSLPKFVKVTGLFTRNQFGAETLDAKKHSTLCVPATTAF